MRLLYLDLCLCLRCAAKLSGNSGDTDRRSRISLFVDARVSIPGRRPGATSSRSLTCWVWPVAPDLGACAVFFDGLQA